MLITRRGTILETAIDERVRKTLVELFIQVSKDGPKSIDLDRRISQYAVTRCQTGLS